MIPVRAGGFDVEELASLCFGDILVLKARGHLCQEISSAIFWLGRRGITYAAKYCKRYFSLEGKRSRILQNIKRYFSLEDKGSPVSRDSQEKSKRYLFLEDKGSLLLLSALGEFSDISDSKARGHPCQEMLWRYFDFKVPGSPMPRKI